MAALCKTTQAGQEIVDPAGAGATDGLPARAAMNGHGHGGAADAANPTLRLPGWEKPITSRPTLSAPCAENNANFSLWGYFMQGCLICGDTRLANIIYHPEFAFRIKRCGACSFVQTDFISDETLRQFYADKYMPAPESFDFEHWRSIRSPQSDAQIGFIREFSDITPDMRTLDYGAATGELVAAFRQHTAHAFALEIDQKFHPRLATIAAAVLDDAALGQSQYGAFFDIITISHVLEHLWDPYQTATTLFHALKPGGWLFVEVPAEAEVLQQTHTAGSGHLWFFEPETIKAFFSVHGMFDLVALRRDGLSVAEYISGLKQGRQAAPRQDLINTADGGSLRLMLRRPLVPHDGPTRASRLLDWRGIAEARGEQISDMFKLILQYHHKLQASRREVELLKKGQP